MSVFSIKMVAKVTGIQDRLNDMIKRAEVNSQFFVRTVVPYYLNTQAKRWMSEGSNQDQAWNKLNPTYAKYKLTRYKAYDGSGTKMLVATTRLVKSVLGQSDEYQQIIGTSTMVISTTVPYAQYVDEKRSISKFSPDFYKHLSLAYKYYVVGLDYMEFD